MQELTIRKANMNKLEVRVVTLEPLRVASAYGFGRSPEAQAWEKLLTWAKAKGLLKDLSTMRFFGFNNPNPSPGSPNYGYEQWMTVGPDVEPEGDIRIQDFGGGHYIVTRCKLPEIGEAWRQLVEWCESSEHRWTMNVQCLEESITPPETPFEEVVMDLYLPILEG